MPSSGMMRGVAFVIIDISEECSASMIMVIRIGLLGTTLAFRSILQLLVTANVVPGSQIVTLMIEAIRFSETSVLTRATRRNIPESGIFLGTAVKKFSPYIGLFPS
jgi:hypothetical protein